MIGLLGRKRGMSQIFDDQGRQVAVTLLEVGPCYVTKVRTQERDGYQAVQLGYGAAKEKRVSKPRKGQFQKAKTPFLRFVREIRTENVEGLEVGAKLTAENFQTGDYVDVTGTSIGQGFQGVVKRHGFKGGEASHGAKFGREPGSTGQSAYPSRVIKGLGLPGQMGNRRVTVQNLKVIQVDGAKNLVVVEGAVPGSEAGYLLIRRALKKKAEARNWKVEGAKKKEASKPEAKAEEKAEEKAEKKETKETKE